MLESFNFFYRVPSAITSVGADSNFSGVRGGPWNCKNTKVLEATFKLHQITRAAFTNSETWARIDALSRWAQGEPKNEEVSGVLSNIRGTLQVTDANAYLSPLEFGFQEPWCLSGMAWRKNRSDQLAESFNYRQRSRKQRPESNLPYLGFRIHFSKMERGEPFCPSKD